MLEEFKQGIKDYLIHYVLKSDTAAHSGCQKGERVHTLKLESDLTSIPGILKPQHHAADEEPDQL